MKRNEYPISTFCKTSSGGTPSRSKPEYYNGTIPWVKSGELREAVVLSASEHITEQAIKESSAKVVPVGALLVAMYGATIGRVAYLGMPAATNQAICNIIPDESKADRQYLFYALCSKAREWISRGAGGAQPNISQKIIQETKIYLPPLEEQKRIAAILDKADAIRKKRQKAIELTEQFLRSAFLDMFGDPITNSKGWEISKLESLGALDRGKSKHRPRNDPKLLGGRYPLIQTGDVAASKGAITEYTSTYSEMGLMQSRLWPAGTLCITIAANIAKTGVLTFDACFPDSVVGFTPNERTTTEFIQFWLSFYQYILEETAPESAQKNINLKILRELKIPTPPIELQNEFTAIVEKTRKLMSRFETVGQADHNLFNTLTQRAFRGEL
jgi:type I restriction enzyme S subunit